MSIGIYKLKEKTSGETRVLFVPRFTGNERKPNNTKYYTIAKATSELGSQFDHTATFFCTSAYVDRMRNAGFINIASYSLYKNEVWMFDNGNYISFDSDRSIKLHIVTGATGEYTHQLIEDVARTFINDTEAPMWLNNVYGWYGLVYSIRDKEFSFNYYYARNALGKTDWENVWKNLKPFNPPTDPYDKGGSTSSGGGGGTYGGGNTIFGGASDSIDIPPLPTASASSAGFITLFNPTLGQLNNLANYMWSDLFSLETFKKIFADPMDCILGLSIVPVKPAGAGTSTVKIGNISTDVSMNKTSSQYVAVDCGTIDVKEYWGAYLDYAPYTQCEIYLPYVGTKQISVDDVMNKAVHVVYHVDILSGACNAYVKCGDSVLYTFVGQCSSSIPISGNDWTNVLNGAISVAGKIGLAMATGGATALMSELGAASSIISSSKPTVERSGAMSSTGGLLGIQKPYLILTRPKQALPENQNKYTGYPSFITMALSECTGYTEIDSIHLENMSCTDEEAQEIENLLKSGVIF